MCGVFLGAAAARRPAVIDGLISAAAALCAVRLCPNVHGYLVPSHASFEIGYRLAMEAMDLRPLFDLGMRLGEGSRLSARLSGARRCVRCHQRHGDL